MATFNHHSFLFMAGLLLLVIGGVLWQVQWGRRLYRIAGWGVLAVLVGAIWLWLRPSPGTTFASLTEADSLIANDSPTVLEFYSDY